VSIHYRSEELLPGNLEMLLAPLGAVQFVERYYHQLPIAVPFAAAHIIPLASEKTVEALGAHSQAQVQLSRKGEFWPGGDRPTADELRQALADGWTLFFRHAERYDERLAALASEFRSSFQAPIDIHLFCTPAGSEGFGWHYDVEDVFIVQTRGVKTYRLRKNTINPWPLVETTPDDLSFEAERSLPMECRLDEGDWLYIPPGYWHATRAETLSISLSVGVMSATALDLLDVLRPCLLASLRWRQRLPLSSDLTGMSADACRMQLRATFRDVADDLSRQLNAEEFVDQFLRWQLQRATASNDQRTGDGQGE
jgi:ribosomal protein L16 Arg81 hydroxylase